MTDLGPVTHALLGFARDVADERELAERICVAYVAGLDVDGASISLLTGTAARVTLGATDSTAELLEDLQFTLNEGACMEAALTGRPVLVPDLDHGPESGRWPVFASAVAEQGTVGALFALPLQWGALNLGVLDLYRKAPGALTAAQRRDALGAADIAALMMLTLRTDPGDSAWLDASAGSHAVIHQATGMVLSHLGVSAQESLARMRGVAYMQERLLVDVARDIVARRLHLTHETEFMHGDGREDHRP